MDIGEKLKQLRLQRNLTQEEMADRCELSKGFISQVERNLASPSIATLTDMLECLGSSLKEFFADERDEKTVFSPADMFIKSDDENLRGRIVWLVPSAQKNSMEPILVEMAAGGQSYEMPPHEGEEFGFVLSGAIRLTIGGKSYPVRKGESFYFVSKEPHTISNASTKNGASFLWIATPPTF